MKTKARETTTIDRRAVSHQLREAILADGRTAYALGRDAGLDPGMVQRFLNAERGLALDSVDRLALALGLRLVEVARGRGRPAKPVRASAALVEVEEADPPASYACELAEVEGRFDPTPLDDSAGQLAEDAVDPPACQAAVTPDLPEAVAVPDLGQLAEVPDEVKMLVNVSIPEAPEPPLGTSADLKKIESLPPPINPLLALFGRNQS